MTIVPSVSMIPKGARPPKGAATGILRHVEQVRNK
jgi:hypothetical protein